MSDRKNTSRRGFLKAAGGSGMAAGYSLFIRADRAESADAPLPPGVEKAVAAVPTSPGAPPPHEPNMVQVDLHCDFLVAGGGMAGVCAALSAARTGARVVLVQNRSRLGGNASSEVRMHIVGASCHRSRLGWRESGILEELRLEDAKHNPQWSFELWDLLLYDKVVSEPNITLLLDTSVFRAVVSDNRIREVWARSDLTETLYRIEAALFADCTGDCRLGVEAGAAYVVGHESRDKYNEVRAPKTAGTETLGSSILFMAKDYGYPIPFTPPPWARKVQAEQLRLRKIRSWEYGYWWIEWGGEDDAIRNNEAIRKELLSIVLGVWDYIKNSGDHPDSANWGMDWIGMIPGKRASRRFVGPHVLTEQDLLGMNGSFEDAVAVGGWPFDDHPPGGFDAVDLVPSDSQNIKNVYGIPLRALYSVNIANLFMAGRNISASHVAFTSTRVMGTCAVEGQAIGTAAALCAARNMTPQALYEDKELLKQYQQQLLRDDQTIPGLANEDAADLARRASYVCASHTVEGSRPENIINGLVRDMGEEWNNRWGAELQAGTAWIELGWESPHTISLIQLTHDSGFSRELTLSGEQSVRTPQKRSAQPETSRDYRLLYRETEGGEWKELVQVEGNYQRLRRHAFSPVQAQAVRLEVTATNGCDIVRLYEMRCYA